MPRRRSVLAAKAATAGAVALAAAQQLVSLHPRSDMLAPALSSLVVAGWAVAVLAAACVVITRRDA